MESAQELPSYSRPINLSDTFQLKVDIDIPPHRLFEDHLAIVASSYQKKVTDVIFSILKSRGYAFDTHDHFINFIRFNVGLCTFSCSDNPSEVKAIYTIIGESVPILWSKSTMVHPNVSGDVMHCHMEYNFYLEDPDGDISSKIPGVAKN